jgi:hypothetical protein
MKKKTNWEQITRMSVRQHWGHVSDAEVKKVVDKLPEILKKHPDGPPETIIEEIDRVAHEILAKPRNDDDPENPVA